MSNTLDQFLGLGDVSNGDILVFRNGFWVNSSTFGSIVNSNKSNVYYDTITNKLYRYHDTTATYIEILQNASLNTQSDNNWFEYSIVTEGDVNIPSLPSVLSFNLKASSLIFYNGSLLLSTQWSGINTSTLIVHFHTSIYDRIRIQQ